MADKRRYTRLHSNFIVRIRGRRPSTFEALDSESRITNISKGGVFIETPTPFDCGTIVDLEFMIPRYTDRVHARGVVRWSGTTQDGPVGMGIEFLEVTIASRDAIRSYIDDRVRAEELSALVSSPARVRLLRLHAASVGSTVTIEALGRRLSLPLEEVLDAIGVLEAAGLVRTAGEEVGFVECTREDLREAIRSWLGAHPVEA